MTPSGQLLTLTLLGAVVLAPVGAPAQEKLGLTVDELVERALAGNPELRAARMEVDAAAGRLRQAGLRPNPMLELGGQKALGPDNNVTVGIALPLDLNGRKEGRVAVADRELRMRRFQVSDRERRLRADVRMKAGDVLAARRALRVTEELLDANQRALRLIEERVRAGGAPALEGQLMLVEVNRLDAARRLQESRLEVATLQLKTLAGFSLDVSLVLRGELAMAPPSTDVAESLRRALASRADVEAARAEVAMGRARIRKEKAEGRWDATINVGYQRQETGFDLNGVTDQGAMRPIQDVFHFFGAGFSIVLPVRNRNEGNIAAAVAETRAAERRVELTELVVRQETQSAFVQHEAAHRSLEIYESGVLSVARQNLGIVREAYQLGRGSLLDVIAEQRRYVEIENGYTDALRQVYDAAVEIERAAGTTAR